MRATQATTGNSKEFPLFNNYPAIWQAVSPHIKTRICSKDEDVVHHGDNASALWLVMKGWVKLTRQTPDGKETTIGLCSDGDVFGEAVLFPNASYPYNASVMADGTELAAIPADIIRSLICDNPSFSNSIMALLNDRTTQAQLKLEQMSTMSAAQRLGCFLLKQCENLNGNFHKLNIPVEKHVLAAYLSMKPETLSRSQQQLKNAGVSVNGHEFVVDNLSMLRHFVCESCPESGNCDDIGND